MERNGLKFAAYRHIGHRRVQGYTETAAIGLLHAVDDYQRAAGIGGPIAEIGVGVFTAALREALGAR